MSDANLPVAKKMDRRKLKTRQQLLSACYALLMEKGFEELIPEDIAERADVGRRTFYNHFANKQDIVIEAMTERFRAYGEIAQAQLSEQQCNDAVMAVAAMAGAVFTQVASDPMTAQIIQNPRILFEAVTNSQRDFIMANLVHGVISQELNPSLPVESLEPILGWGFIGLVIKAIESNSQDSEGKNWAQFVLQNFGVSEERVKQVLAHTFEK